MKSDKLKRDLKGKAEKIEHTPVCNDEGGSHDGSGGITTNSRIPLKTRRDDEGTEPETPINDQIPRKIRPAMPNNESVEAINSETIEGSNHRVKTDNIVKKSGGDDKGRERGIPVNNGVDRKARKRLTMTNHSLRKANNIVNHSSRDDEGGELETPINDQISRKKRPTVPNNESVEALNCKTIEGGNHPVKADNVVKKSSDDDKRCERGIPINNGSDRKARKRLTMTNHPLRKANNIVNHSSRDDEGGELKTPINDHISRKKRPTVPNNQSVEAVNSKTIDGGNHPVNIVKKLGGDDKGRERGIPINNRVDAKARKRLTMTKHPLHKANNIVSNSSRDDEGGELETPINDRISQKQRPAVPNNESVEGGNHLVKANNIAKESGCDDKDGEHGIPINNRVDPKTRKRLTMTNHPLRKANNIVSNSSRDDEGGDFESPINDQISRKKRPAVPNNESTAVVNDKAVKYDKHLLAKGNIVVPDTEQIPGKRRACIVKPIDFNNNGTSGFESHHLQLQISNGTPEATTEQAAIDLHCDDDIGKLPDQSNTRRRRNRIANKAEWPREITKTRRQHGQTYIGYEKKATNVIKQDKLRSERKMGPRCTSTYCLKSTKRSCSDLIEDMRKKVFKMFWEDMNWDQKKIFIVSLVDVSDTNTKYVENSRRSISLSYFLRINGQRKQVCKYFFLSTFGLNEGMVHIWVNQSDLGIIPAKTILNSRRAVTRPISKVKKSNEKRKEKLIKFFDDLPKMESHYCRQQTEKQYLQPDFQSYAQLYRVYVEFCHKSNEKPLSICFFNNLFHSLKLGLFQPKKDRCDTCVSFEAGNVDKEEYENHLKQKKRAREEKKADKAKGVAGKAHVLLMDVQAVKLLPVNNCNSSYFKTKLKIHNFTIFDMATTECVNYWWHEGEGEFEASMFATCILKFLDRYCYDTLPVILWSDGCTYQNRNQILGNALLDYAIRNKKEVTQKFLIKGHTQMEVDNVHMLIEKQLKGRLINLPSMYISLTKKARKTKPLEAELLTHEDFKRFDDPDLYRYSGIRPGKKAGDATVYDLRSIHYNPSGDIDYKLDFDEEAKPLPGSKKIPKCSYLEIKPFYDEPPKITKRKYDDLQDLKRMLPKECWYFYDGLKY